MQKKTIIIINPKLKLPQHVLGDPSFFFDSLGKPKHLDGVLDDGEEIKLRGYAYRPSFHGIARNCTLRVYLQNHNEFFEIMKYTFENQKTLKDREQKVIKKLEHPPKEHYFLQEKTTLHYFCTTVCFAQECKQQFPSRDQMEAPLQNSYNHLCSNFLTFVPTWERTVKNEAWFDEYNFL